MTNQKAQSFIEEVETREPNESQYQSMMRSELSLCILDMCCDPGGGGGGGGGGRSSGGSHGDMV